MRVVLYVSKVEIATSVNAYEMIQDKLKAQGFDMERKISFYVDEDGDFVYTQKQKVAV